MRFILFLAALLAVLPAAAETMAWRSTDGRLVVTLSSNACEVAPLGAALTDAGIVGSPKAATVTVRGQDVRACWGLDDADMSQILIGDEAGHAGTLKVAQFKPAGL